ncbi:hypothetical protein FFLO_07089 [Filobasidium floriforme]|uniref:Uncharacterized protein n=1 Tax=Filobasidium floriforme TaxID=5210 RepID=A0A8K0JEZ8_9TREE|nr:uncharacterized protein HD553DRAFT_366105 [Filobasidium floriforme]KAG7527283.1 hypothetical protein FFLO_07089 [Filobasidium floriforme]KAH8077297.1 hypothetical protein HD553DRAFT_366105 [Filobasidium floriforme]
MTSLLSLNVETANGELTIPCIAHDGMAYYGVSDDDTLKAILSGEMERKIDEEEFQKLRTLLSSTDAQVRQAVQKLYESHRAARWQEFHTDCDRIAATIQADPDTTDKVKKQMDIEVFNECLLPFHYGLFNTFLLKLIAERLGRGAGLHVELLLLSDEKVHQMNRVDAAGLYTTVRTLQYESALDLTSTSKETCIIGALWLFLNQVGAPEWKFEQLPGLYMVEDLDTFRDRSELPEDIVNATVDCLRIVKENEALVQGDIFDYYQQNVILHCSAKREGCYPRNSETSFKPSKSRADHGKAVRISFSSRATAVFLPHEYFSDGAIGLPQSQGCDPSSGTDRNSTGTSGNVPMALGYSFEEFYLQCFYGVSTPSAIADPVPLDLEFRIELSIRQAKETIRMLGILEKVRGKHEVSTERDRLTDWVKWCRQSRRDLLERKHLADSQRVIAEIESKISSQVDPQVGVAADSSSVVAAQTMFEKKLGKHSGDILVPEVMKVLNGSTREIVSVNAKRWKQLKKLGDPEGLFTLEEEDDSTGGADDAQSRENELDNEPPWYCIFDHDV